MKKKIDSKRRAKREQVNMAQFLLQNHFLRSPPSSPPRRAACCSMRGGILRPPGGPPPASDTRPLLGDWEMRQRERDTHFTRCRELLHCGVPELEELAKAALQKMILEGLDNNGDPALCSSSESGSKARRVRFRDPEKEELQPPEAKRAELVFSFATPPPPPSSPPPLLSASSSSSPSPPPPPRLPPQDSTGCVFR